MRTNSLPFVCVAIFVCGFQSTVAQTMQSGNNVPLTSFADSLRARGIDTFPSALVAALHNDDPKIRALAAYKLAEDRHKEAIPAIEAALSTEKNPQTRVGISSALWSLGDEEGRKQLETICTNPSLPTSVITNATNNLQMRGQGGKCANTILTLIDRATESYQRQALLPLFPGMYSGSIPEVATRMVASPQGMLSDKSPAVRIMASHVLVQMGSKSSAELIQSASMRETDPVVQSSLIEDLAALDTRDSHRNVSRN
jgi:HEAT repeat protein